MKLTRRQRQFLDVVQSGRQFKIGKNKLGWTIGYMKQTPEHLALTELYGTITMRSLERKGLIVVNYEGVTITQKGKEAINGKSTQEN